MQKKEIEKINKKVEEYSKLILENKNTMMIIVADHGHLIVDERIDIKNSEISKYLENPKIFIENRAPAFLVKKGEEENFKKAFNKDFGNKFYLLSKEEILNNKIFGEFNQDSKHELFESSVGDFIALPKDSSKSILLGECDQTNNVSFHGGYSDDEIYIPLIVISN